MLNTQFFKKFAKPELKSISGKRYSNLLVLSTILILSMMAIGLGEGAISYLDKKMNNPFVSFVNVQIPYELNITIEDLKEKHNQIEIEKQNEDSSYVKLTLNDYYGFNEPYAVYDDFKGFTNLELNITEYAKVRKGRKSDPVYDFILQNDTISAKNEFNFDGWGCVVSLDYLTKENKLNFGRKKNKSAGEKNKKDLQGEIDKVETIKIIRNIPFLNLRTQIDGEYVYFSVPIQGFVSSFPDDVDVLLGEKLFNALYDDDFWLSLESQDSNRTSYLQYYVVNDTVIENFFVEKDFQEIEYDDIIHEGGKMFKLDNLNLKQRTQIINNLPKSFAYYNVFDFNLVNLPRKLEVNPEIFVFEFYKKLDKISEFNDFLMKNTLNKGEGKSLKIDMRIIESKKNFDLFNKLADLLAYALIFFSIFSIVLYITNLIVSHISKNKKNLGSLKAFGLSNNNIILIYSAISIALITISFIISFFISALIGNMLVSLIANHFNIGDASSLNYISYPVHVLAAFFIMLPSVAIYLKLRIELKDNTPGDLIYGRE